GERQRHPRHGPHRSHGLDARCPCAPWRPLTRPAAVKPAIVIDHRGATDRELPPMNTHSGQGHGHGHGHDHHHHHHHPDHGQEAAPGPAGPPPAAGTVYTCPMHPEIRRDAPGTCPICGMSLEPLIPELEADDNPELRDFQRRFWWTLPLSAAVFVLAMFGHRLGWFGMATQSWIELVLSLPIVLWAGW